ncbi:MAG: glutathione S-transferase family protein [Sphingomonadales bacterium]|nr:glutathione S-transferase family protein [Sphingomonadales bacterium]
MKIFIGNKAYSSWSMRGWLACKQSGLAFEEAVVPLYSDEWDRRREGNEFAPGGGKVPILWDGDDCVVWDSLAIIEYLNDKTGNTRFWPEDPKARAMARSMAAEMHSSFAALRRECPMNIRRIAPVEGVGAETRADIVRILEIWAQARARYGGGEDGGDFLFGAFGAVDIMFAPVVTRFVSYGIGVPPFAAAYMEAVIAHRFVQDWIAGAQEEEWVIDQYEAPAPD